MFVGGVNHKYVLFQVRSVHKHKFTHTTLTTPKKSTQLFEAKALDRIPMCPRERLVFISISTGLSFAKKGLGHLLRLFFITCTSFCCLIRKPLKIHLLSICKEFLLHTTVRYLLLLVGIDTPIYQKYYDTPPIIMGQQDPTLRRASRGAGASLSQRRWYPSHFPYLLQGWACRLLQPQALQEALSRCR